MKITFASYCLWIMTTFSSAKFQDGSQYTSMSRVEMEAFQDVALWCDSDVHELCDARQSVPSLADMLLPADPLKDFGLFMDSLMDSVLVMPPQPSGSWVVVMHEVEPEDNAAQTVISQLAASTHPDDVEAVTQQMVQHGQAVMEDQTATAEKRRMARRLTEVAPEHLHQHRLALLPFGSPQRNRCLQTAFEHAAVTHNCGVALENLQSARVAQYTARVQRSQYDMSLVTNFSVMYAFVIFTVIVAFLRKRKERKEHRRLKINILKAIYSTPALKNLVEERIGEEIGSVPPLPWFSLMKFGRHAATFRRLLHVMFLLRISTLMLLMTALWTAPQYVLPLCVCLSVILFGVVAFAPKPVHVCACCCCSATTDDAKNGSLTAEQACCGCCQGTGVCAPSCASCCGANGDAGCNCDGDNEDCCCDDDKKTASKEWKLAGDCECCCCCNATLEDRKNGTLTVEQACCGCCQGSGVCSAAGCGRTGDTTPQKAIYEAIPIQIV